MRPSASGFGFGGTAGCTGGAAQSVPSEGDRSFGFWPRTTSRGKACAGESAQAVASLRDPIFEETEQAVAVTLRSRLFGFSGTAEAGCAGGAAQAVVSLCDMGFEGVGQAVMSLGDGDFEEVGPAALLRDGDFEDVRREVTSFSSSFSAASSDSSAASVASLRDA